MCYSVWILLSATGLTREECWVDPGYSHATHRVPDVWVANDELGGHLTKISATGFLGVVGSRRRLHTPEHQRVLITIFLLSFCNVFTAVLRSATYALPRLEYLSLKRSFEDLVNWIFR